MVAASPLPIETGRRSLRRTLGWYRHGAGDPTTRLGPGSFARATLTPDGPGTVLVRWPHDHAADPTVDCWGPGGPWLADRVASMTGAFDEPPALSMPTAHLDRAVRDLGDVRFGASGTLYHELLPVVLQQRVTSREGLQQWRRLCGTLGEPAPGPIPLRLPPAPETLARRPAWWFHPLGIEAKRARALAEVARVAHHLWDWADLAPSAAGARLAGVPGVGCWTIGSVLGPALGDPDAVAVGDYHLKHMISWAFAGEPRGTDDRMLELLAPYAGQRGRVVRLVAMAGIREPAFGPRRRILPMQRW